MPVRKKNNNVLLTILSILLVALFILKFDVVTNALDPKGTLGLANIADDAFPIVMGAVLITVGIAAAASPLVAIALIAVGVGMVAFRAYKIYKRKQKVVVSNPA